MNRRWLAAGLLLLPLLDALLLVFVAVEFLGAVPTVAAVVLTGLVGMLLVRAEGRRTIARARERLAAGQVPTDELLDGGMLVAAGAFLLTPGLVSDAVGLLFAVPLTRAPIRAALRRYVVVPYVDDRTDGFATGNVYVGGFPGDDEGGGFGAWGGSERPGPGPGPGDADFVDRGDRGDRDEASEGPIDEDAYDIDVESVRDDRN